MSKPRKPTLVKLSELQKDQYADCYAQLGVKTRGSTREGKPFYTCRFRDAHRTVSVMIWADSPFFHDCQDHWQAGQFFKLRGTYGEHDKYGPQFEAEQARPVEERDRAEGFDEHDFVERSRFDPKVMLQELHALAASEIQDLPLRMLVQKLLTEHAATLERLPASTRHAYPFAGGWLEHTLNVARNCIFLAGRYAALYPELKPPLNRDLIIAAAILHDIGRLAAIEVEPGQPARNGVAGELFGPLFLSYDLIRTAARAVPDLNPELVELLSHMVISHLRPGEARLPCIPEALILHHADALDTSFEMFARCLARDSNDGPFTERDAVLGRWLLKQRKV
jgi:3'-5' exoribonuclease